MHDELTEATEALSSSSAPYGEKKRIGQSARSNRRYALEKGEREIERAIAVNGKEGTGLWRAIALYPLLSLSLSSRLYPPRSSLEEERLGKRVLFPSKDG